MKVQNRAVKTSKLDASNITGNKLTMDKGSNKKLETQVTPITSSDKVLFKASNTKVATVNKQGKVIALKKGKTVIRVASGKKTVKIRVTVK